MSRLSLILLCICSLCSAETADLARMARAVDDLPVQLDGRVKPFSSAARHCLLSISGRTRVPVEGGPSLSASAWLLEGLADSKQAMARPVVRLRNPDVAQALGLPVAPGLRYTATAMIAGFEAHNDLLEKLFHRNRKDLGPVESQLVEVTDNLSRVLDLLSPQGLSLVPGPAADRDQWLAPSVARIQSPDAAQGVIAGAWTDLLAAVRAGDAEAVDRHAMTIRSAVAPFCSETRLAAESIYNRLDLFTWSMALGICSLLALGLGLLWAKPWLRRLAVAALVAGTVLHVVGLCLRMWILGRPPVATLYESIVFVGAVAAILGLVVEWFRKRGDGVFIGAAIAVILHLVALGYAEDGDTMGMLVAVLNSRFWLTIHVLTITAGYGICLVAGLAGHVALAARALYPQDAELHRGHDRALVGLTLVGLFFTLFGTILGGIWADQSWGRFWGWDPKENGALLIVLWQLLYLHLRLVGWVGPLGFALGMVLGNIVVAVAWFGVNLLGVGLHSYGFTSGLVMTLAGFAALEMALGFGLWAWARARRIA